MGLDPKVTVIVPTRNRSGYLGGCLGSLAEQSAGVAFEVLVVDNGSTDSTPQVVEDWSRRDARFRAAREGQVGLSRAKNTGVELARGELLLFTDDDVIVGEGWIDSYWSFFQARKGEDMVAGGPILPIPHDLGNWPDWLDEAAMPVLGLLDHGAERPLRGFEYVWGGNMAVPARVFQRFGPWNESIGRRAAERGTFEDTEYQDRLRAAGGTVWFCPGSVVQHRLDRGKITPRHVLLTAFALGRNDYARDRLYGPAETPRAGLGPVPAFARLGVRLVAWLGWTALFRLSGGKAALERARRAAWTSGWWLDRFRVGKEFGRLSRMLGRAAFVARAITARLVSEGDSREDEW